MKLPGFTAEASLYKASGQYQTVEVGDHTYGVIYPALQLGPFSSSSTDYILRCMRIGYRCHVIFPGTSDDPHPKISCGFETYFIC
jgi:hypothetical protein